MLNGMIIHNQDSEPENSHIVRYESVIINAIHSQAFLLGNDMGRFKRTQYYCDYCGRPAFYQFNNGKWCCEKIVSKCPAQRKKSSLKKIGVKRPDMVGEKSHSFNKERAKRKTKGPPFCGCGCKKKTRWNKAKGDYNVYINGHNTRVISPSTRPEIAKKISEKLKGIKRPYIAKENNPMHRPEVKAKISKQQKALGDKHIFRDPDFRKKHNQFLKSLGDHHIFKDPEFIKKNSKRLIGNQFKKGHKHTQEFCDNQSKRMTKRMLNGQAAYMCSFIKNPSKPQVELFDLVKRIYPQAILNYPSLNRSIDIAIPNKWIAIEYDCWYWHQDKQADEIRQKELEGIGWRFLRYKDYMPDIDKLKMDLRQIANHLGENKKSL